jgi:hypothetical protein
VLRLEAPDRFALAASDPLGRALWSIEVDRDVARWSRSADGRECRIDPERPLELPRLAWDLPIRDLAPALVGRVPESPPAPAGGDRVDFRDEDGRRWSAERDERGPLRWTLWSDGRPALWWSRGERGGVLSSAEARLQIRWREVAREALRSPLPTLAVAAAALPECLDADLS